MMFMTSTKLLLRAGIATRSMVSQFSSLSRTPALSSVLVPSTRFPDFHIPKYGLPVQPKRFESHSKVYDYKILRERPLGPHKKLQPKVKYRGRIGPRGEYHRIVHYPKDGKYTIKRLPITKLGGRCIVTGRKIIGKVGGGSKQKFRWVDYHRFPLGRDAEEDYEEKIIKICYDPCRKAKIALVAHGNHMRWIIATANMKDNDIITSSGYIPPLPVKPIEGNSYPIGALPEGTEICLIQNTPGGDVFRAKNAEQSYTILKRANKNNRVVIKENFKKRRHEFAIHKTCQCTVGQVSIHWLKKAVVGSPNRARWMGKAPGSGKWYRKTGIHGRKIRKIPPVIEVKPWQPPLHQKIVLHALSEGTRGRLMSKKREKIKLF